MAKLKKKKKSSAKKSAAHKTRSARKVSKLTQKVSARRPASKKVIRVSAKAAKPSSKSPKPKRRIDLSAGPLKLMGNNHRERKLDPFTRAQKAARRPLSACIRPMPDPTPTIATSH